MMGSGDMIAKNQIINLIRMGFVVAIPEYRLCPQVSIYDGPIRDARDVYVWCQEKLPSLLQGAIGIQADGKRLVAWGHSAGANLALHLVWPKTPLWYLDQCLSFLGYYAKSSKSHR